MTVTDMTRRHFLGSVAALGAAGCKPCAIRTADKGFVLSPDGRTLNLPWGGLGEQVRVWVAGDTHFGMFDDRDARHADNCRRMSWLGANYAETVRTQKAAFERMLTDAKREKVDLLLLVGDVVSFPTLANVEYVTGALKASGVDWMYVAGNHDWHFEGDLGSDLEQRDRWIPRRLGPFYPTGEDPLMQSRVVKGIRFVAIDDSAYLIRSEQLEFWKAEAAKGDPIVLAMHIPLFVEGWGILTCGCPDWNAANDPYWEIERREKWRAEGPTAETFAFREAVLSTPNLVGGLYGAHPCTDVRAFRGAEHVFGRGQRRRQLSGRSHRRAHVNGHQRS